MHPELILISNEYDLPYEMQIIHALFENGLEQFHLRKPLWDIDSHLNSEKGSLCTSIMKQQKNSELNCFTSEKKPGMKIIS